MTCWNCGKKGDFAGQLCDECFKKMERNYEIEQEEEYHKRLKKRHEEIRTREVADQWETKQ